MVKCDHVWRKAGNREKCTKCGAVRAVKAKELAKKELYRKKK